jgi:hypothetical protein
MAMCLLIISIAVMMRYVLRLDSISAVRSSQKSRLERALARSVFFQTPELMSSAVTPSNHASLTAPGHGSRQ